MITINKLSRVARQFLLSLPLWGGLGWGLLTTSCNDWLDLQPEHSMTQENAITTYNAAQQAVRGIYGEYVTATYLGGYLFAAQHSMAGIWSYLPNMATMSYRQSSNDNVVNSVWSNLYMCINAANAAIDGISKLPDENCPSPEARKALLAEARCFRGYCNLELLWCFGHWFDTADSPYGIIYRDKVSDLSNLMVNRSTVGESYNLIIEDLKYAEENLGDYKSALYMSRQFAQAMHAKLLLVRGWDGDYAEALKLVNDILATAPATFKMESDLSKLYENGWNSKEVLFSRYLGDKTSLTNYEAVYSYALFYSPTFQTNVQEWLEADERYPIVVGTARSPETWDTSTLDNILVKLYHRGRYEGKDDMYASYLFRYAELYIMKAELLALTNPGNLRAPIEQLNLMRASYTNPVMAPLSDVSSYDELMDIIFREYCVTLLLENESPWFASLRINHNGQPWILTLKDIDNINRNMLCWPIPDSEMTSNKSGLKQNPDLE